MKVAFIGLGYMGSCMAHNVLKGLGSLSIYNRSPEKAAALVKEGAVLLKSPTEAFQKADIVISMLSDDAVLEEITKSLLESIRPGCIHLSMSTVLPDTNRSLAALHRAKGAYLFAAPVFGRPEVAAAAKLWISLSGPNAQKKQIEPILRMMGQRIEDFGEDPGSANVVKLAGNFLMASAMEAMGEAWELVSQNHIDKEQVANYFEETLFSSPVYQTYGKIIAKGDFRPGLKMKLGMKDIRLARKVAESSHVSMPLADLLYQAFEKGVAKGRGDMDWSAISLSAKD